MADPIKAGVYTPELAKSILDVVAYLMATGFIPKDGQRTKRRPNFGEQIYVHNDSGEEIPAYACVQATGTVEEGGVNYLEVDQPADDSGEAGPFFFNGHSPIEIDGYGFVYDGPLVRALGNGSTATAGDLWTPVAAQWKIAPGGTLLTMVGEDDIGTDVVRVVLSAEPQGVIHAKTPAGGIAGRTGLQMAYASCDLYDCDQDGLLSDSGTNVDIYNPSASAVAALNLIVAAKNTAGLWVVILEDCP